MSRAAATTARTSTEPCEAPTAANGCFGLRPQDLHTVYQLPASASGTQTIALVDAYNDPHAETDLEAYDREFGLPPCTTAEGCFTQVNQKGERGNLPFPKSEAELLKAASTGSPEEHEKAREAEGWSVEISLDIESARAICQSCHIALVEANSPAYANLEAAEDAAVRLPAQEVSNSWGSPECEAGLTCIEDGSAFNHPGVVITASAGDDGYLNWLEEPQTPYANYPASSPHVVAVGGTRLEPGENGEWAGESVWNDGGESDEEGESEKDGHGAGGGGCSIQFAAQPWQQKVSDWSRVGCAGKRAVADVAADADPYTGLAVYDSSPECREAAGAQVVHWCAIGGTSLASPLIASVFALAGGAHGIAYPAQTLYENAADSPTDLHDVTEGSNGACLSPFDEETESTSCTPAEEAQSSCLSELICLAGTGYDGPTGLGTPDGIAAFQPSAAELSGEGETGKNPVSAGPALTPSPSPTPTKPALSTPPAQIDGLALTLKALIALDRSRPKIDEIGFTFLSNANLHVLVSLQKRVSQHRRTRWETLVRSLAITVVAGRNSGHLSGRAGLNSGTYRLTLTLAHGAARSLVFKIG